MIGNITKENVDYYRIYVVGKDEADMLSRNGIRVLDKGHSKDIYNDIMADEADFMAPISVNINTMGVYDGVHRFNAILDSWKEGKDYEMRIIFYDVPPEKERATVVKVNTSQKSWTVKDYVHKLEEEENKSIKRLNDFCRAHDMLHGKVRKNGECSVKLRYGMAFLLGENATNEVKNGTITVTNEAVKFGNELYPEVKKIYDVCGFTETGAWFQSLIEGWYAFRSNRAYAERYDRYGGFDRYIQELKLGFDTEKVTSKLAWLSRFSAVLDAVEKKSKL